MCYYLCVRKVGFRFVQLKFESKKHFIYALKLEHI